MEYRRLGNTRSSVELKEGGSNREISAGPNIKVETSRWYDVKLEVKGDQVTCWLDSKLIQTAKLQTPQQPPGLYALGGKDEKTGQIILKALNPGANPLPTSIRIEGGVKLMPKARVITLAGDKPADENTLDEPTKVVPVESTFEGVAPEFNYTLKPYSLTIFRIDAAR